jgi:ABC-type transporter Mla subunit MlaD
VTQALTGTEPHDLARLIAGTGRTAAAFAANQQELEGLIDNFDTFTGALSNQSDNLATTVRLLAPTLKTAHTSLVSLNNSLPPLRTYAIELTPAVAELPGLIKASKPWLAQVRPLLSGKEAGGTAKLLAESTPGLAGAAQAGNEVTLPQLNQLSLCTSQVLVPTGNEVVEDQFSTGGPNYREFIYDLTNFAAAAQNFDGNGPLLRAQASSGPILVGEPNPQGNQKSDKINYTHVAEEPLGTQPQLGDQPELKPEVRCDTQPVPDVNGSLSKVGPPSPSVAGVVH